MFAVVCTAVTNTQLRRTRACPDRFYAIVWPGHHTYDDLIVRVEKQRRNGSKPKRKRKRTDQPKIRISLRNRAVVKHFALRLHRHAEAVLHK